MNNKIKLKNREEYLVCVGGNWNITEYINGNFRTAKGYYSNEWLDDDQPIILVIDAISAYKERHLSTNITGIQSVCNFCGYKEVETITRCVRCQKECR